MRSVDRGRTALASAGLALVVGAGLLAPAAHATSTPEQQSAANGGHWYADFLSLDQVHATTTGTGVTIAVVDDGINLTQPELTGANVAAFATSFCPGVAGNPPIAVGDANNGGALHGTLVSSYVSGTGIGLDGASSIRGVAPGAQLRFYGTAGRSGASCNTADMKTTAEAVDQAVADGADIVSLSFGNGETPQTVEENVERSFLYRSLLAAMQAGVLVVTGAANVGGTVPGFPAGMNGAVTVECLTPLGTVSAPQVTSPDLGVVAPCTDLVGLDASDGFADVWPVSTELITGTSLATPMVASALALSMSAWPDATPNQVLQALVATSHPVDGSAPGTRTDTSGFGAIDLAALVDTDPTTLPDSNPFIRADGLPTPAELAAGATQPGTATPTTTPSPTTTDEATNESPDEATSADPAEAPTPEEDSGFGVALPLLLVLGGGVLVAVAVTILLLRRRGSEQQSGANYRNGPHGPNGPNDPNGPTA